MPERFTPEELRLLIDSGDLTEQDLLILDKSDARVAGDMMMKGGNVEVKGGTPMPPLGASAIANAPSIAQAVLAALGLGGGGGSKTPARPTTPPAPGQRKSPVMGSRVYGPKDNPSQRPPAPVRTPPNFEKHGNLTRPGPDAHKGGGGPSSPSSSKVMDLEKGKLKDPESVSLSPFKGPLGDDSNFKDVPRVSRPTQSVGAELNKGDRRSASRNSEMYEAMKSGLPDGPGAKRMRNVIEAKRKNPTAAFDEADKRTVTFGGLNPSSTDYRRPQDRKPLSKREIEQLIANILKLSE